MDSLDIPPSFAFTADSAAVEFVSTIEMKAIEGMDSLAQFLRDLDPRSCFIHFDVPSVYDVTQALRLYYMIEGLLPPERTRNDMKTVNPDWFLVEKAIVCYCNFFWARTDPILIEKTVRGDCSKPKPEVHSNTSWLKMVCPAHEHRVFANRKWKHANDKNKTNIQCFTLRSIRMLYYHSPYANKYKDINFFPSSVLESLNVDFNPAMYGGYPKISVPANEILNTFVGFANGVDSTPFTWDNWKKVQHFLAHVYYSVCQQDVDMYDTLLTWMACIFHFPWYRERLIPVFNGPEGAGKTTVFKVLERVIGKHMVFGGSDMRTLGLQYSTDWVRNLLIHYDEVVIDQISDRTLSHLKDLTGSNTNNYEVKYGPRVVENNYARVALASNSPTPTPSTQGHKSRRWVAYKVDISEYIRKWNPGATKSEIKLFTDHYWMNFWDACDEEFDCTLLKFFAHYPTTRTIDWVKSSDNMPSACNARMQTLSVLDLMKHDNVFEWIYYCVQHNLNHVSLDGHESWMPSDRIRPYYEFYQMYHQNKRGIVNVMKEPEFANHLQTMYGCVVKVEHRMMKGSSRASKELILHWGIEDDCREKFENTWGSHVLAGPPDEFEALEHHPSVILKDFEGFTTVNIPLPNMSVYTCVVDPDKGMWVPETFAGKLRRMKKSTGIGSKDTTSLPCERSTHGYVDYHPSFEYFLEDVTAGCTWTAARSKWYGKVCHKCKAEGSEVVMLREDRQPWGKTESLWTCMDCAGVTLDNEKPPSCDNCRKSLYSKQMIYSFLGSCFLCKKCMQD